MVCRHLCAFCSSTALLTPANQSRVGAREEENIPGSLASAPNVKIIKTVSTVLVVQQHAYVPCCPGNKAEGKIAGHLGAAVNPGAIGA